MIAFKGNHAKGMVRCQPFGPPFRRIVCLRTMILMDKKSEEELQRIANRVTAEMIRDLKTPKTEGEADESDPEAESEES